MELEAPPLETGARPPSRALRRASRRQELDVAEAIGGKRHKASGACVGQRGDCSVRGVSRGEMKCTTKKSTSIKRATLDKIRDECQGRERPFIHLQFLNPLTLAPEDEWVIIPMEDWKAPCP